MMAPVSLRDVRGERCSLGDWLIVETSFRSDSDRSVRLRRGQLGTITAMDEEGDIAISFNEHSQWQWVFHDNFPLFLRKMTEPAEKEVILQVIPQNDWMMHWTLQVGASHAWHRIYEFERQGVCIGSATALDRGYAAETHKLQGLTTKSFNQIDTWAWSFHRDNQYCATGVNTFGGKNCQDFVVELCEFLQVDTSQLPWRQAFVVKHAAASVVAPSAVAAVVLGAASMPVICVGTAAAGVAYTLGSFLGAFEDSKDIKEAFEEDIEKSP